MKESMDEAYDENHQEMVSKKFFKITMITLGLYVAAVILFVL